MNTFWAASQGLWNATYILLALSASLIAPSQKTLVVGRAAAAGGAVAVLVPIAAGWLSDRTRTRWGRRRPWIAVGAAVNASGRPPRRRSGEQQRRHAHLVVGHQCLDLGPRPPVHVAQVPPPG
jgi:hypothetical protein